MSDAKTQFILKGFRQVTDFRIFTFDAVAADRSRTEFTIKTDLALAQRHGIRLQELPLLCREVLERGDQQAAEKRAFTYTEKDMLLHAASIAKAAPAHRAKPPRNPASGQAASPWRTSPPKI